MPVKKGGTTKKKPKVAKLAVRVLNKKAPMHPSADRGPDSHVGKKIIAEDLLPESRDFLDDGGRAEDDSLGTVKTPEIAPEILAKEDKYKSMVMWSGITFFMLLISIVWIFNMRSTLKESAAGNGGKNQLGTDWDEISAEMSKVMATLDEKSKALSDTAAGSQQNVLLQDAPAISTSSIDELKNILETASGTPTTTSEAGKTKK